MRPVLLEMTGFASFREPTSVDFTDADYFALVGPTGSGKSTVVDAMTFALYGSAPRWGRRNAISFALAPTTSRGTVKLVFDVGPHRYLVARQVRRIGSTVQMKGSRFERLTDPAGLGDVGEPSESLASDGNVSDAVEKLLGLTFEQFCQCVVLPQGEFAEFLQSAPRDRQKILLKLLGAEHYEEIARRANQKAALAEQRASVLAEQLTDLADATDTAEQDAREQQTDLERLMAHVEERLPVLAAAAQTLTDTRTEHDRLIGQQATLATVTVPAQVATLDSQHQDAKNALAQIASDEAAAQERDTLARREVETGPVRGPLEMVRAHHAEHADKSAQLPTAESAETDTAAAATSAVEHAAQCEAALDAARAVRQSASDVADSAQAQVRQVVEERALLVALVVPADIADLIDRLAHAHTTSQETQVAVERAEDADEAAQAALAAAPDRAALVRAREMLSDLADRQARIPGLVAAREQAEGACRAAEKAVVTGSERVRSAEHSRNAARQTNLAAALRPHLETGQPCPVCEQPVTTLPAPLDAPEVTAAEDRVTAEQALLTAARKRHLDAQGHLVAADGAVQNATAEIDRLRVALAGGPHDLATVVTALSALDDLTAAARTAKTALQTARKDAKQATDTLTRLTAAETAARTALRTARDPVVRLGAPAVDDSDLRGAWTTLVGWANRETSMRTERLDADQTRLGEAVTALERARSNVTACETDLTRARNAHRTAVQRAEQARAQAEALRQRLTELTELLANAPTDADAEALLAHLTQLEAHQRQASTRLLAARTAHEGARDRLAELDTKIYAEFTQLRKMRDLFVALDVPELPHDGLLATWTWMARWADERSTSLLTMLPEAAESVEASLRAHDEISTQLATDIVRHGLDVPAENLASKALPVVTGAVERARAATDRIHERRTRAARLTTERADADTEQQVAKMLGDLLRADRFQRWLATTALDALVVDASASLAELSGGQFDLTHDKGEFFVIDHADADSRRSVRTLSGGETFQASLALALALSAHMSTLATSSATRLDSIFLDEGFGTLDPDTLEVVATTLEGLAQGERMVGVITHVAALADRVPVRFRVHRDATTSSVIRESA